MKNERDARHMCPTCKVIVSNLVRHKERNRCKRLLEIRSNRKLLRK